MKTIIISLLLFFTVNAQTAWYLDKNATGSGNGTSWANAWTMTGTNGNYFVGAGEVDWSVIGDGDTLYISGGTDSLIYYPRFSGEPHYFNQGGTRYTYSTQVVICPAWVAGRSDWASHNGRVILGDSDRTSSQAVAVFGGYLDNVKLYGITIQDLREAGQDQSLSIIYVFGNDIVLDSDTLLTSGQGGGGGFGGDRGIMRNCVYIEPPNENTTASDFWGQYLGKGGSIIENNKIFIENNYTMIENLTGTGVTFTDTSMTDATLTGANAMTLDYHQWTLIIVPFGVGINDYQYMSIFSNDTNTFYGNDPDLYGWHSPTVTGQGATTTTTSTSLTDTYGGNPEDAYVGWTITCASSTMIITSNTADTFYGSGWTPSQPASGNNYTIENRQTPANGSPYGMEGVHRDIIQYSYLDSALAGENFENIVRNNLIVDQGVKGTGWNSMIYTSNPGTDIRFLFYNNIFVNKEEISSGGIFLYSSEPAYSMSIRAFNNTIITKGDGAYNAVDGYLSSIPISLENFDTVYVKNNIVIVDTTNKAFVKQNNNTYAVYNNNIYASDGYNLESFAYDGSVRTWDNWVAQGYDTNSDTMQATAITFANKYGRDYADYYTETGRDLGSDLTDMPDYAGIVSRHPDILKDILGNNRGSNGAWDIGSLEWQGDVTDTIPTYTFTATTNVELNSYNIRSAVFANADSIFTVWTETADSFKVGALSSYDIIEVEAEAGDTVFITNIASGLYETETLSYIRAGGNTQSYSVTTKSEPVVPVTGNKILKGNNGLIMKDRNGKIIRTLQ